MFAHRSAIYKAKAFAGKKIEHMCPFVEKKAGNVLFYFDETQKMRYIMRNQIEQIVKKEQIDRALFHEVSKCSYEKVLRRFYYAFFDYKTYPKISFSHLCDKFHSRLQESEWKSCADWVTAIQTIDVWIPDHTDNRLYYWILDYGWVYEGRLQEIQTVLCNIDGMLEDFFLMSKRFDWLIAYSDDGCSMGFLQDAERNLVT